jgi:hypothetical protein
MKGSRARALGRDGMKRRSSPSLLFAVIVESKSHQSGIAQSIFGGIDDARLAMTS